MTPRSQAPAFDLRNSCVFSRSLLPAILIGMTALATPRAHGQYSTTELTVSTAFPASSQPLFGQPISTDGTYAAYSTDDAIWSQPIGGGTPKKLFSVGDTLPGSKQTVAYMFGQTAISEGTIVFFATDGGGNQVGLYGLYSIKADGSGAAQRVADSTQVPNTFDWFQDMNPYGVYGVFQVSKQVVVFALAGAMYAANTDGSNLRTLWETVPKPGFQGCSTAGVYHDLFLTEAAYQPATDGTSVAFAAGSYLDFVALYKTPLTAKDSCADLITSGVGNTGGPVSTLPGQPQDGIAFTFLDGQDIQIDGDYVYFGASAQNGVTQNESYTGYFKIPLAGGPATAVVTNISHVPGLTNPDGSFAQVSLNGFAVNNGKFVFYAQDVAGNDPAAFYMVRGSDYVQLFASGTSVDNQCVGGLENGSLAELNSPSLSSTGQLVFTGELLSHGPDLNGSCNGFFRFQPIGYFALDTTHLLLPTETSISISPSTGAKFGQPLTMNIAVAPATGASNPKDLAPKGVVTVYYTNPEVFGVQTVGSATIDADGKAKVALGSLSTGIYTYSAAYGGDSNFSSSASAKLPEDLLATTTIKLTASATSVKSGKTVTFTATATNSDNYPMYGSVSFLDGTTVLNTQPNNSGGSVTFTASATQLACATSPITAYYNNTNEETSTSATSNAVQVTGLDCSATALTGPASAVYGSKIALTSTVSGIKGGPSPAGTVAFSSGTTAWGTATLNSSGVATLASLILPGGADAVTATYSGDTNYLASASPAFTVKIGPAASGATLTASTAKPTLGETITLTATVTGTPDAAKPSGTVVFMDGKTTLGNGTLNASGVAELITGSLTFGANSVTAAYNGDTNYSSSVSSALALTAGKAVTVTAISDASASVVKGTKITFEAKVSVAGSTLVPTGEVTFKNGTATMGTVTLSDLGVAALSTTALTVGTHTIAADYVGATDFASSSASLTETITPPPAATPKFNPVEGTYSTAQSVTLTDATAGAAIYYTTNGTTTPSITSTRYKSAIAVTATETIQAIAIAPGYADSVVAKATYTIK